MQTHETRSHNNNDASEDAAGARFLQQNLAAREQAQAFQRQIEIQRQNLRSEHGFTAEQMQQWRQEHQDSVLLQQQVPEQNDVSVNGQAPVVP